eukprot:scaffold671653_cov39-Prasinocladus_malaysianus.AAC.1
MVSPFVAGNMRRVSSDESLLDLSGDSRKVHALSAARGNANRTKAKRVYMETLTEYESRKAQDSPPTLKRKVAAPKRAVANSAP